MKKKIKKKKAKLEDKILSATSQAIYPWQDSEKAGGELPQYCFEVHLVWK